MKQKNSKQAELIRNLQSQLQENKQACLQHSIFLQSLESTNAALIKQNNRMAQELQTVKRSTDQLIGNQKFHIQLLQDRNKELLKDKREIEAKHDTLKISFEAISMEYQVFRENQDIQMECMRKRYEEDIEQYKNAQANYKIALTEHERLIKQINQLKQVRGKQAQQFHAKLSDKERQKIQSIDHIKKQMLTKANQMRNNALQIRKQQLQITTRLTFLQNDQLIRQLEYHSSKTEEILKRNTQLQEEVKKLKRSVEIHEGVQKQIMKRNVMAKNIIQSLNQQLKTQGIVPSQKIKSISEQNFIKIKQVVEIDPKRSSSQHHKINNRHSLNSKLELKNEYKQIKQQKQNSQRYENLELIKQKVKNLQTMNQQLIKQNKMVKAQLEELNQKYRSVQTKNGLSSSDDIAKLINRYYLQVIKPKKQLENENEENQPKDNEKDDKQQQMLKQLDVEKWPIRKLQKVLKIILNWLRPHISSKILKLPYFKQKNKTQNLDYESLKQNLWTSKYIQALKRQKNKSLETIKQRSMTYIIDESQKKKKNSTYRRISTSKMSQPGFEPVAKRFLKPRFMNKT